jgi:hypothetical protein
MFPKRAMNKTSSVVGCLAKCALLFSVLLLFSNLQLTSAKAHAWLSSCPLALAGAAYAVLQISLEAQPTDAREAAASRWHVHSLGCRPTSSICSGSFKNKKRVPP